MVPEYPEIRHEVLRNYRELIKQTVERMLGPLAEIRQVIQFEGGTSVLKRADGSSQQISMIPVEASGTIFTRTATMESIPRGLIKIAEEFARKKSRSFYEAFEKICDDAGQTVDARGQKLSVDVFLQMLNTVQIDFDEKTRAPRFPKLVLGTGHEVTVENLLASLREDPVVKAKFDGVVAQKFEEWRDREADRKLVG